MSKNNLFKVMFVAIVALFSFSACQDSNVDDIKAPQLTASPDSIAFDGNGGTKTIEIVANCEWDVNAPDWVDVTPSNGRGNATISVTAYESQESNSGAITFTTYHDSFGKWGIAESKVRISQSPSGVDPEIKGDLVFENNFDKEIATQTYGSGTSWPYLDQFEGWKNHSGKGADNVDYDFKSCSARANSASNGNYSNYDGSGGNNIMFAAGGFITIENIALESKNLKLTFGTERYLYDATDNTFINDEFNIVLSNDGTNWSAPITYSFPAGVDTNGKWNEATADFTLPEGTTTLYIKFSSTLASAHRLDDVKLFEGAGGQLISFGGGSDNPDQPVDTSAIFYNDFDKEVATKTYGSGSSWPYLDQFEGWKNQTGSGVANVDYDFSGTSARANSTSNSEYSAYAGSGNNNIFFGKSAYITIENISVATNKLQLTFGGEKYTQSGSSTFSTSEFTVCLSGDGNSWSAPISYSFESGANLDGTWNLATADFTIPENVKSLYIKFAASVESVYRLDDVKLTAGNGGQQVDLEGGSGTPDQPVVDGHFEFSQVTTAVLVDGDYLIVADGKAATPIAADKNYGYPSDYAVSDVAGIITASKDYAFTFKAVDGGYTIQQPDGRYLYMEGEHNSPNLSAAPTAGHIWSVMLNNDNTYTITNNDTQKSIQRDANYSSFGVYPDLRGTLPALYIKGEASEAPETPDTPVTPGTGIYESDSCFICNDDSFSNPAGLGETKIGSNTASGFKLGTGKASGVFTSAAVGVSGDKYLNFYAVAWKGKSATLYVRVNGTTVGEFELTANEGATSNPPFNALTLADTDLYSVKLTGLTASTTIDFSTSANFAVETDDASGRAIVCGVKLTDEAINPDAPETPDTPVDPEEPETPVDPEEPETPSDKGNSADNAYTIAEAIELYNNNFDVTVKVWVKGVIKGYWSNEGFVAGTTGAVNTNIALGDGTNNIPVKLPSGNVRTALNLVDNAGNLNCELAVYGNIMAYFSVAGIQNVTEFVLGEVTETPDTPTEPETPEEPETPVTPDGVVKATVAEFLAAAEDDTIYELTGEITRVANNSYGNFDITDETGTVYVYGLLTPDGEAQKQWAAAGLKLGDTITIKGTRTSYNDSPQMKNAIYISHEAGPEIDLKEGVFCSDSIFVCSADNSTNACYATGEGSTVNGEALSGVKLGKSSVGGTFTSAAVGVSGNKTLTFYALAWNGKSAVITISVDGTDVATITPEANSGVTGNPPYTITGVTDSNKYTVELNNLTATSTVTFATKDNSKPRAIIFGAHLN